MEKYSKEDTHFPETLDESWLRSDGYEDQVLTKAMRFGMKRSSHLKDSREVEQSHGNRSSNDSQPVLDGPSLMPPMLLMVSQLWLWQIDQSRSLRPVTFTPHIGEEHH